MEQELESLGREFRLVEESHGKDVSNLVIVVGYLRKLLENARVLRHLGQHHPEILTEFRKTGRVPRTRGTVRWRRPTTSNRAASPNVPRRPRRPDTGAGRRAATLGQQSLPGCRPA